MRTRWKIQGHYIGRLTTGGETRHCVGFDFTTSEWHLHGNPIRAAVCFEGPVESRSMVRLHRSLSAISVGEAVAGAGASVMVSLSEDEISELRECAGEPYALDATFTVPCDLSRRSVSLVLEIEPTVKAFAA
jgi:hypothetical protein